MKAIKLWVYNVVRDDDTNNLAGNIFDYVIITIIIINVLLVILDTFDLPLWLQVISRDIEIISVIIFTIEYLARLWTATYLYPQEKPYKARIKYMLTFMAIIDLLAILPFYLPYIIPMDLRVLRTLRIIRLLRLFKLNRYTDALLTIGAVFQKKGSQLLSSIFVVSLLMIIASVLMYNFESEAQPDKFSNAFSGLWWAVATVTTVGYGDIYPVTVIGKILSGIIALLGIGLVAVPTGIISAGFIETITEEEAQSNVASNVSHADEMMKFKQLLDNGAITVEEYQQIKTKLINSIK